MAVNFDKFGSKAKSKLEAQATAPRQSEASTEAGYGIFDLSKAPYEIKAWKPKKGDNLILILPVEVGNPENPAVRSGAIEVGEYDYGVSLFTHMGKGTVAGVSHICLKRNFGRTCPRCEEFFLPPEKGGTFVKGVKGSGNAAHVSSERNYFLVVPFTDEKTPDTDNMGLWNSPANFKTGFPVVERAKEMADGMPIIPFWWPTDDGRLVSFHMAQASEKDYPEYSKIKFVRRPTEIAKKLAEKYTFALDTLMIVKTKDQINVDMFGGPDRQESHDTHEATDYHGTHEDAPEPGVDPDAFGAPEPVKEEAPKETPEAEESKATDGNPCPYGHKFGPEYHDFADCNLCKRDHRATHDKCEAVV